MEHFIKVKVMLSGLETPGEDEHTSLEYVSHAKASPGLLKRAQLLVRTGRRFDLLTTHLPNLHINENALPTLEDIEDDPELLEKERAA